MVNIFMRENGNLIRSTGKENINGQIIPMYIMMEIGLKINVMEKQKQLTLMVENILVNFKTI